MGLATKFYNKTAPKDMSKNYEKHYYTELQRYLAKKIS
jgi:hypothetical protein